MKKIALLTSGGDAPGMNGAIRAVVRHSITQGWIVFGVHRGYQGMIDDEIFEMGTHSVAGIIQRGGTILKTARSEAFRTLEGRTQASENLKRLGINQMVVIGGDGSMRGAETFSEEFGISTMTIPGTIDNDMNGTEYTIGFDTALNNILDAINKIRDTANSHQRVAVVEVMGRHAGHLALMAAISCGAEVVLVPEIPWSIEEVCERIELSHQKGKLYSIVLVAEGAAKGPDIGKEIEERTGADVNVTVLGYLQRGGSPTALDNIISTQMGVRAVDELAAGKSNCLIGMQGNKIVSTSYIEVKNQPRTLDLNLYDLALSLSR